MICTKCGELASSKSMGVYEIYDDIDSSIRTVYCNHGGQAFIKNTASFAMRKAVEAIEKTRKLKQKWRNQKANLTNRTKGSNKP